MKVYNSLGPNPRALRMFLLEKGLELPMEEVDLMGEANRQGDYLARNPGGQIPALELDDGYLLGETTAIFDYLEAKHPEPALVGSTEEEKAITRQWQRRIEERITLNLYNGFRFSQGLDLFKNRVHCIPEAAEGLKEAARKNITWLDQLLDSDFVVGNRFTTVDIALFACLDFVGGIDFQIGDANTRVQAWFDRVKARPTAEASLHPASAAAGFRG